MDVTDGRWEMKSNGGYFPFPNDVVDKLMCLLTGAEFKVLSVIIRQTLGWRKHWDRIAVSQFRKKTGLSKPGVMNSLDILVDNNLVLRDKVVEDGCLPENWYALFGETNEADRLVKSVDQYSELTSQLILREMGSSVDQLGDKLVRSVDPQKKALTKTKDNNYDVAPPPENEDEERWDRITDALKKSIGGDAKSITLVSNDYQREAFNAVMEYPDEKILHVIQVAGEKNKIHQGNAITYVKTGLEHYAEWYGDSAGGAGQSMGDRDRAEAAKHLAHMKADLADLESKEGDWSEHIMAMRVAITEAEVR